MSEVSQSTRLFNTAIISTKALKAGTHHSTKLAQLVKTPGFQSILEAIQTHAKKAGIPEAQASEEIIQTFRQIDEVWDAYIFQEGLNKLRGHLNN